MAAVSETVLDRLAKLMNFAANATGPEAEVAAQRAAELMAKYQIDEAEASARLPGAKPPQIERGRVDADDNDPPQRAYNSWKGMLVVAIAKSFGGCCFRSVVGRGSGAHRVMMFGPVGSVSATRYLYRALVRELERRVRRFLKETGGRGPQGNAYLHGAVIRICQRLEEGRAASMKEASSQALVVIDKTTAAAEDAMQEFTGGKLKGRQAKMPADMEAKIAGWSEAGDLDIGDAGRKRLDEADDQLED